MDQSIVERQPQEAQGSSLTEEQQALLAFHPSTKHLDIPMTPTPEKGAEDKRYSTQIVAHGYDLASRTMRIEFRWGNSQYDYHRVPPEKAASILECESFGAWVNANLKGVHHYECVRARNNRT